MDKIVSDVKILYDAFISLCDHIETHEGCGNCPLWRKTCSNDFGQSLQRIRDEFQIKRREKYGMEE